MRAAICALAGGLLLAIAATGCSADTSAKANPKSASGSACPKAWRAGWQRLANEVKVPVYCPTWMPSPLNGKIGGAWSDIHSVTHDRSYLISFLYHEPQTGDVHVNFRGYPGRATIPRCRELNFAKGKAVAVHLPCFADPSGHTTAGSIHATFYTVNQDADMWHVLYAWRHDGTLYAVSQHVTAPLTYRDVRKDLNRVLRGLVLVRPSG
jgi:hypothetical protein